MTSAVVAAVDWGTSSLRVWLLDRDGGVLAGTRSAEGMEAARETGFGAVLERMLGELGAAADLPAIICGMAGARQGWIEAPYVDVPCPLDSVLGGAVHVSGIDRDVRIVPGLAQRDPHAPDVMRGEETQLAGAAPFGSEPTLACLPGTHSKWVSIRDGRVTGFRTFITGDHYAALAGHTILRHSLDGAAAVDPAAPAFADGVRRGIGASGDVGPSLFAVRAGGLLHGQDADASASLLSGLLIGGEIASALRLFGAVGTVTLIASGRLADLYAAAFATARMGNSIVDADEAVRRGLFAAAGQAGLIGGGWT
ncbi:MAG: 2-dehydro-3-deoxygalactonokinase [Rhizobiaceae bacterium]